MTLISCCPLPNYIFESPWLPWQPGDHCYQNDIWGDVIRITSVNSTNQASDVCRRTTSGSDNNNPHSNVNNNMTTSNVFDFKQYEVDKMYSPQCKRETLYCYNNARSIKRHSPNF